MRVLIADDDELMRELIGAVFTAAGHETQLFADGAEVFAAYEHQPAPCVVLDWMMPVLDGLEVCRRIRTHHEGANAFILVVTAAVGMRNLEAVLDAGADDYLSKPVTPDDIAARIRIAEKRIEVTGARLAAEDALRKARYLAGIGEVSLALQHEINNPLAALLTNSSLITSGMLSPDEVKAGLVTVEQQARRIADVVKRLSTISDPKSVEYVKGARMVDLSGGAPAPPRKPKG
jgi:DNA-binding response OmpR family regulator